MDNNSRQEKERIALINEICEKLNGIDIAELLALWESLKQVTSDPEKYFKKIDNDL